MGSQGGSAQRGHGEGKRSLRISGAGKLTLKKKEGKRHDRIREV